MDKIEKTGLDLFTKDSKITSETFNILNDRLNSLIDAVNSMLNSEFNVNTEFQDIIYTLNSAKALVPYSRRIEGLRVRFKSDSGWVEYVYLGGDWNTDDSWSESKESNTIDGGEW